MNGYTFQSKAVPKVRVRGHTQAFPTRKTVLEKSHILNNVTFVDESQQVKLRLCPFFWRRDKSVNYVISAAYIVRLEKGQCSLFFFVFNNTPFSPPPRADFLTLYLYLT